MNAPTPSERGRQRRRFLRACGQALAAAIMGGGSRAALAWPDQPITLVVPFTPGTGVDVMARQFAPRLAATLGQPVIVENVVGAAGTIGTEKVARARPDGYTLIVQSLSFVVSHVLYKGVKFDPLADFAPISLVGWQSYVLVVPAALPVRTVADLLAAAAAAPGKLTYATPGVGTAHHLATAQLLQKAGVSMLHVPYKGTAGAVADLLGGRVDAMLLPASVVLPHVQAGRLTALATGSPQRLPQLPQVPTLGEARLDVGNLDLWYGFLAPKGTPAAVVERLNQAIAAAAVAPGFAAALDAQGIVVQTSTAAAFARLLADENARWTDLVVRAGIRGE